MHNLTFVLVERHQPRFGPERQSFQVALELRHLSACGHARVQLGVVGEYPQRADDYIGKSLIYSRNKMGPRTVP